MLHRIFFFPKFGNINCIGIGGVICIQYVYEIKFLNIVYVAYKNNNRHQAHNNGVVFRGL